MCYKSSIGLITIALSTMAACGGRTTPGVTTDDKKGDDNNGGAAGLVAEIVRPNGSLSVLAGTLVSFRARFTQDINRVEPDTITWDSHLKGFLGDTNPLPDVSLAVGDHEVTVAGTLDGRTARDSVTVHVGNIAARIVQPDSGDVVTVGGSVTFTAVAEVREGGGGTTTLVSAGAAGGERVATFAWTSSEDGAFGTGDDNFTSNGLSAGEHTIVVTVSDDQAGGTDESGSASVLFTVRPPNTDPVVAIIEPAACPIGIEQGDTSVLTGTVTDPDPVDSSLDGEWVDTMTGQTREGNSITIGPDLAIGKHQLIFSATDAQGARGEATCGVLVFPAGGAASDVFPNTGAINAELQGGDRDIGFIAADASGNTFVGNDEGVTIFSPDLSHSNTYDGDDLAMQDPQAQINGVIVSGATLFVASDEGLSQCTYDAATQSITLPCTSLHNGDIEGIHLDGDLATGAILAGAVDGGLYLASFSGGALQDEVIFDDGNSNLPDNHVNETLFVDGILYAGSGDGLCIVEDAAGALAGTADLCTTVIDDSNSALINDDIDALLYDGEYLWMGTHHGLVRYNLDTGSMIVYDARSGLGHNRVNDLAIDDDGVLWVGTERGVSRFDPDTELFTNLGGADFGLNPGEFEAQSIYVDGDGTKWVGTNEFGVVQYTGT